jgi:hypothetical protein
MMLLLLLVMNVEYDDVFNFEDLIKYVEHVTHHSSSSLLVPGKGLAENNCQLFTNACTNLCFVRLLKLCVQKLPMAL